MVDARPRPIKRIPRDSNLLRDLIGGCEADTIDVFRQYVRITPHFFDRLLPIGLEDSHCSAGAHTMAVEEQHDFTDLFCLLPGTRDTLLALWPDPIDGLQFRDPVFDQAQDFGSEPPDQFLGENRPDAFDKAAAEVTLDAFDRRRRHGFHQPRLELEPVLFVSNPPALGLQPLPSGHGRQGSKHRYLVTLPSDFYPKHTEAVFFVVEGDALDQAGDFLGARLVRTFGIHLVGDSLSHGFSATRPLWHPALQFAQKLNRKSPSRRWWIASSLPLAKLCL